MILFEVVVEIELVEVGPFEVEVKLPLDELVLTLFALEVLP